MTYIEEIRQGLATNSWSGNSLLHDLTDIIREARKSGVCDRDYVVLNNTVFRMYPQFQADWRKEMDRFCIAFELKYSVIGNGNTIEFRDISNKPK